MISASAFDKNGWHRSSAKSADRRKEARFVGVSDAKNDRKVIIEERIIGGDGGTSARRISGTKKAVEALFAEYPSIAATWKKDQEKEESARKAKQDALAKKAKD